MAEQKKRTAVRKAAPRKTTVRRKQVAPSHDEIATRAYFLHVDGTSGGELDHWLRAERELATA